jgi:hypothetical protein
MFVIYFTRSATVIFSKFSRDKTTLHDGANIQTIAKKEKFYSPRPPHTLFKK